MILGVDHVALSCRDVQAAAAILAGAGFRTQFIAVDIPNAAAKRPLLRQYLPTHSLAYCRPAQGIAVELTAHGPPATGVHSPYRVVFNHPPPDIVATAAADGLGISVTEGGENDEEPADVVRWQPFEVDICCHRRRHEPLSVSALVLPVRDLDASSRFWCQALGFRDETKSAPESGRLLAFRGPVPAWNVTLRLAPGGAAARPFLDDAGFPCLALLARNLDESVRAAVAAGAHDATPPFAVAVGGKQLQVAMFRGPDHELIELIEFQR